MNSDWHGLCFQVQGMQNFVKMRELTTILCKLAGAEERVRVRTVEQVDSLETFMKTGFVHHVRHGASTQCACLTCGLHCEECPAQCAGSATHAAICTGCAGGMACFASLQALLARAREGSSDRSVQDDDAFVDAEHTLKKCEEHYKH